MCFASLYTDKIESSKRIVILSLCCPSSWVAAIIIIIINPDTVFTTMSPDEDESSISRLAVYGKSGG